MNPVSRQTVFQLGMTSDNSAVYADAAHQLGYHSCLVDSGSNIKVSQTHHCFDSYLELTDLWSHDALMCCLRSCGVSIGAVVPGVDASVYAAHTVARSLKCNRLPFAAGNIPNKAMQREILRTTNTGFKQPRFLATDNAEAALDALRSGMLNLPIIIKPVKGNGGMGVCLVTSLNNIAPAMNSVQQMHNGSGERMRELILEEYIEGSPCSLQGIVASGKARVYSFTYQLVTKIPSVVSTADQGFDEQGHITRPVSEDDEKLVRAASSAISQFGLANGAFYIDMIDRSGEYYFIEAGFRLSASGVVRLTNQAAGVEWGADVLSALTGKYIRTSSAKQMQTGQAVGRVAIRNPLQLRELLKRRDDFKYFKVGPSTDGSEAVSYVNIAGTANEILQTMRLCLNV